MPQLRRVMPGKIQSCDQIVTVRSGHLTLNNARFADLLERRRDGVLLLARQQDQNISSLAKAIACRRIVIAPSASNVHEPYKYCRQNKVCRSCYYLAHQHRAAAQVGNLSTSSGRYLHQLVFTFRVPYSYSVLLDYASRALHAKVAIAECIQAWNRSGRNKPNNTVSEYVIGLHLKGTEYPDILWPHIHVAVVVDPTLNRAINFKPFKQALSEAFRNACELEYQPKIEHKRCGQIGNSSHTDEVRRQQHHGRVVTAAHLTNVFAYTTRITERNDTPEIVAIRSRLLADLNSPTTYTRSRKPVLGRSKATQPDTFDPMVFNQESVFVFPLDGSLPVPIDPKSTQLTHQKLVLEAETMLRECA